MSHLVPLPWGFAGDAQDRLGDHPLQHGDGHDTTIPQLDARESSIHGHLFCEGDSDAETVRSLGNGAASGVGWGNDGGFESSDHVALPSGMRCGQQQKCHSATTNSRCCGRVFRLISAGHMTRFLSLAQVAEFSR
jgi:hypothetical protein